jgi:hypothetical protein
MPTLPEISITKKKLNKEDIDKLNKLSSIMLNKMNGGAKKKSKTRKISRKH